MEKQAASETEPEPLIELGEEIKYKRDNVVNLGQMLKGNMPNEFKEGPQRALQDSAKMAKEWQCKLGDLRACLEFRSFDSEAGSYRGPAPSAAEAVSKSCPLSGFGGGGGQGWGNQFLGPYRLIGTASWMGSAEGQRHWLARL